MQTNLKEEFLNAILQQVPQYKLHYIWRNQNLICIHPPQTPFVLQLRLVL